MIKHSFTKENTIENVIEYLKEISKTINIHTSILNHYLKYTLHLNSQPQTITYLSRYNDTELKQYFQELYNFTQEEYESYSTASSQIASQDDSTREQLIQMTPEAFEMVVDCCYHQIPSSPLLPIVANLAAEKELSDIKIKYVEERLPSHYAVSLVTNKKIANGGIDQKYIDKLYNWTDKHHAEIIFNSDDYGRDLTQFNHVICGRKNFAIFIVTGINDIFGSFHGKSITSPPRNRWEGVMNDEKFFVFTCKNSFGLPMEQYYPLNNTNTLNLFPNRDLTNLFMISNCYQIGQFECWAKRKEFMKYFKDVPQCSTMMFTGDRSDKFIAQKIIVFQLS